jgi:hypothetical protein
MEDAILEQDEEDQWEALERHYNRLPKKLTAKEPKSERDSQPHKGRKARQWRGQHP